MFYYCVVNLLRIVIHYSKYSNLIQNIVLHCIFSSESVRVLNSLRLVNSLRVLFLVCRGSFGHKNYLTRPVHLKDYPISGRRPENPLSIGKEKNAHKHKLVALVRIRLSGGTMGRLTGQKIVYVLPALLQKLVGEIFLIFRWKIWWEIWRGFCGIFSDPQKKGSKISGKIWGHFS